MCICVCLVCQHVKVAISQTSFWHYNAKKIRDYYKLWLLRSWMVFFAIEFSLRIVVVRFYNIFEIPFNFTVFNILTVIVFNLHLSLNSSLKYLFARVLIFIAFYVIVYTCFIYYRESGTLICWTETIALSRLNFFLINCTMIKATFAIAFCQKTCIIV